MKFQTHTIEGRAGIKNELWLIPRDSALGTILLFHGYSGCKSNLIPLARQLHTEGYNIVLVDFAGSGGSSGSTTSLGYHEAEEVAAVVRFCQQSGLTGPLLAYGESMGAVAIIRAISRLGVKVDGAVLESPFDRMLSTVGNRFHRMGLPAFPFAHLMTYWGGRQLGFDAFEFNPEDDARWIEIPVLFFHGGRDVNVTAIQAESIFNRFRGPKRFVSFKDLGHQNLYLADRDRWLESFHLFVGERR